MIFWWCVRDPNEGESVLRVLLFWFWYLWDFVSFVCTRVEKNFPSSVWTVLFQCIHRLMNILQSLVKRVVQTVLLSIFRQGSWHLLLPKIRYLSCPQCASEYAVNCIGICTWRGPVPMHAFQGWTMCLVIFPVAGVWVYIFSWLSSKKLHLV